ncbi:hypothetical protein PQJ75_13725 [Rhodoplanes sp. TEM]|uniref:ParB-like N-terminal domain-containing protein n=1 Tax=Rhodoplanes tepidamans TaxID=200616 RepID=A0ABT5JCU2_RHOTP|nr:MULTISPECIES: hypothetical protein [Rhodoplanes]MDC7787328.1 hypothetical protein [Rhodoplanes tepidamans]MDC7984790.1 hypothetical protein [Rhodoplanes sp. TEM]MDQ0358239.1 ParB family chromosome partitioning protein [Rhodoplanes tepidamans]
MTIKTIEIEKIDASGRLRPTRPEWIEAFAEQIAAGDELPAIEVVEAGDGYRLITGKHRLEAHRQAGRTVIAAEVKDPAKYGDEASRRLREIKENFYRVGLTELDRCVAIAAWKDIYEATNPLPKRGRKSAEEIAAESAGIFSASFSKAAAEVLAISERSVQVAVKIATGIEKGVRAALALHQVADHQADLLALAQQTSTRQEAIAALLLDPEQGIDSVAVAIATLDRTPARARAAAWEKLSNRFARLKEAQQHAFFEAHHDAITLWLSKRSAGAQTTKR